MWKGWFIWKYRGAENRRVLSYLYYTNEWGKWGQGRRLPCLTLVPHPPHVSLITSSNNSSCIQIVVVETSCMETELQLESLKSVIEEFPPTPVCVVCHHGQQRTLAHVDSKDWMKRSMSLGIDSVLVIWAGQSLRVAAAECGKKQMEKPRSQTVKAQLIMILTCIGIDLGATDCYTACLYL